MNQAKRIARKRQETQPEPQRKELDIPQGNRAQLEQLRQQFIAAKQQIDNTVVTIALALGAPPDARFAYDLEQMKLSWDLPAAEGKKTAEDS